MNEQLDVAERLKQLLTKHDKFPKNIGASPKTDEDLYLAIEWLIASCADKLIHEVVLDDWAHVLRVMKEFKKKVHAQYYLHVDELDEGYGVKVFKRVAYD